MLMIAVTGLFALVFARAVIAYARSRDAVDGVVALVFTAMGALFFLQVFRLLVGTPPRPLSVGALLLLLGQPFLILVLVAMIRRLSWLALALVGAAWAASAVTVLALPSPLPVVGVLGIVTYFVLTESVAAAYLAAEARRRTGSLRYRLGAAATGTGLFAVAILTTSAGSAAGSASTVPATAARVIALGSAVAYVVAFLPPRWLRRQWSARVAYDLTGRLLAAPAGAAAQEWQHFADAVFDVVGAAVLVVRCDGDAAERIAVAGDPLHVTDLSAVDLRRLATGTGRGAPTRTAATARGRHYVTVVPVTLHGGHRGALMLFNRHRSLFTEDEVTLLSDLGRQVTVLADRAALTEQLTTTVTALRAANNAKSDFVAAMSHELRTPLNAIIGFSELMGFEEQLDDRRLVPAEWIENVHSSGRHLLGLINDVLDLAKVESGRIDLRPEPLDAGVAVAEAVAPLRSLVDSKRLKLTVAVPAVVVTADRMRLRQMLNNLLSNAIKFTPAGGDIYISARRFGDRTHLTVADTGPGIEPADQERVFEEFHQSGDAESRAAGTGLGLALTRRLAEAHGGRVELTSELDEGSRFTLVLPGGELPEDRPGPDRVDQGCATGGVLVVEDDPAAASLMRAHLTGAGYAVQLARSGEDGLSLAQRCIPDAILLDVLLPGVDGWTVLQRLRSDVRLRHIPVAMVTVVDEQDPGLGLGTVDHFVKPLERGTLLDWLTRQGVLPPLDRPRVLVVDPDPEGLATVHRSLVGDGVAVVTATNGADALAAARRHPFDLVICAAETPDLDGVPFLGALHADPATRDAPVLVLSDTGLTDEDLAGLPGRVVGALPHADVDSAHLREWLGVAAGRPELQRTTA